MWILRWLEKRPLVPTEVGEGRLSGDKGDVDVMGWRDGRMAG